MKTPGKADIRYIDDLVDELAEKMDVTSRDRLIDVVYGYAEEGYDMNHYMLLLSQYDTQRKMILRPYQTTPTFVEVQDMLSGKPIARRPVVDLAHNKLTEKLPRTQDPNYGGEGTGAVGLKFPYWE